MISLFSIKINDHRWTAGIVSNLMSEYPRKQSLLDNNFYLNIGVSQYQV